MTISLPACPEDEDAMRTMTTLPCRACLAGTLVLAFGLAPAARQAAPAKPGQTPPGPQVTFRLETNYVEVDAVVTDSKGNFVRNLTRDDFQVFEDGKPQSVDTFSLVDIPLEKADAPLYRETVVEPDVVTNDRDIEGRIYLIVLDSNHVQPLHTTNVKRWARDFILNYMAANDEAAVVQVGKTASSQDFTSNKRLLLASVDKFMGQALRSSVLNKFDDVPKSLANSATPSPADVHDRDEQERYEYARATLQAMEKLSQFMAGIRGRRKAMILFSEGLDINMDDTIGPGSAGYDVFRDNTAAEAADAANLQLDMQSMFETATRSNVAVYTVDPRGLADAMNYGIELMGPVTTALATDTTPASDTSSYGDAMKGLGDELVRSQGVLRTFSEQTGGLATVNTNNFADGFQHIVQDNSTYYVLGYHAGIKHDGKFHNISVKLTRPGLQVRARKGYYALKASATPAPPPNVLVNLLTSPMPMSGLAMHATADVLRGTGGKGLVQLTTEVAGDGLTFAEKNGTFADQVDVSYLALDPEGAKQGDGKSTADLALKPNTKQAVVEHGLRFTSEFELPPGRYQLRVAGHETGGDRAGSVFWDVTVPDFSKPALALGDLLLTSTQAGAAPTINNAPTLKGVLPAPATTARTFSLEDTLALYTEIYDNDAAHPHSDTITVTVTADDGTQVFTTDETRTSESLSAASRASAGYLTHVPLEDLVPGRYVLTVELTSSLGGDPVKKEIEFAVK
jgi:VWFA-related protein